MGKSSSRTNNGEKEFGFLVEEDCPNTVKEAMDSEEERNGKQLWKKK